MAGTDSSSVRDAAPELPWGLVERPDSQPVVGPGEGEVGPNGCPILLAVLASSKSMKLICRHNVFKHVWTSG